ncbi:MAG: protein-L-isoaspartate O-methyltransferase [Alphaproteobacteria bacterium]|nr:protein-L-isoaspartate O-methyltransferase [Alphaproteobacteria bacterium]
MNNAATPLSSSSFETARFNMVESQIRPFSVMNEQVINAFSSVAREEYIPVERRNLAYLGGDLPMGKGRFMVEPAGYARLLQEAHIVPGMRVLDIGCLTGYTTAILSYLTAEVTGLDSVEWVMQAKNLAHQSLNFVAGELAAGAPLQGPFDVIVLNGAVQRIPEALIAQVKEGGLIACFWRGQRSDGHGVLYHKQKNALRQQILFDAFVPILPGFEEQPGFIF